jgi:hypothetical protein
VHSRRTFQVQNAVPSQLEAAATLLAAIELCRTGLPSRDVSIKLAQGAEYLLFIA